MACPLCNHERARPSWLGSTSYRGREFSYAECLGCGTLYCDPMPDAGTLAQMYGPEYGKSFASEPGAEGPQEIRHVVELLKGEGVGTFVDFGCGSGLLLKEALKLNWRAVGVEFDSEVARSVAERTGARVVASATELSGDSPADVLHLGDVIEHLTELNRQMPEVLNLIKPGGLLIAQGPLEANANLFTLVVRLSRLGRGGRPARMAPYHVMLATSKGQRTFFRRFGLEEVEYSISEVAWPAPGRLSLSDLKRPRSVGLYALRVLSQAVSALRPNRWGNRYFYVGRRG